MDSFVFGKEDWDFPFYKVLSANDTGTAPGHQGGMVVPKDLRGYFPNLYGEPTEENPTIDHYIHALLVVNGIIVGHVQTRYQIQTWGGTRSAESRLTGNLGPLRDKAKAGDILVIQRSLHKLDLYRLSLVSQETAAHKEILGIVKTERWGTLGDDIPVSQQDMDNSEKEEHKREDDEFTLFEPDVKVSETRSKRVARSLVFRLNILELYESSCAVCNTGLKSPSGAVEVDAAHIVSRRALGSNDVRNGLSLCKSHHWAFDKGLFSVDSDRKIYVPAIVKKISQNKILSVFDGKPIHNAKDETKKADLSAFEWHRKNILIA